MSETKKKSILQRALASVNKSEAAVQKEILTDRLEDFIQEATEHVSDFTVGIIPTIEKNIVRAKREVAKAKKNRKGADLSFSTISSYNGYVDHLNACDELVEHSQRELSTLESKLSTAKAQLVKIETTLETLQS